MTVEERLIDALRSADEFQPSPDLFARLQRTIEEDRAFRRRRLAVGAAIVAGMASVATWVGLSAESSAASPPSIDSWRLVVTFLALAASLIAALAPHIKRFAAGFVDDVFLLAPETGRKFSSVINLAYYVGFAGLAIVDADLWALGETVELWPAIEEWTWRLGFFLLLMGLLHAVNVAVLPVLGLVYNSIVRRDLRRRAGDLAPPESVRARTVDRHARSIAIGLAVLVLAGALSLLLGPLGALILEGLG